MRFDTYSMEQQSHNYHQERGNIVQHQQRHTQKPEKKI